MRSTLVIAALALLLPQQAHAWGDVGHKIVCEIAFKELTDPARAEVKRLIATDTKFHTFSDSCTGPDHPHVRPTEHYINVPRDMASLSAATCPMAPDCLFTAIEKGSSGAQGSQRERWR